MSRSSGSRTGAEERVHAVVVLEPGADPEAVVRAANLALRRSSEDPRHLAVAVRRAAAHGRHAKAETPGDSRLGRDRRRVRDAARRTRRRSRTSSRSSPAGARSSRRTTLDELGLSSLERVELMVALEEKFGTTVDEAAFATAPNVAALEQIVQQAPARDRRARRARSTSRGGTAPGQPASLRRVSLPTWILPLARAFAWIKVEGLEHLKAPRRPGHVRVQPPEPHGHAGDPLRRCRRSGATASRWRWRRSSSRRTSSPSSSGGARGSPTASTTTWRRSSSTPSRCRSGRPARDRRCGTSVTC